MPAPCAGILIGHSSTGLIKQLDKDSLWELRKPVPGQYTCRNLLGQEDHSSNGKLKCQGLMV